MIDLFSRRDRIRGFVKRMNGVLRELEAWKRTEGLCIGGITCDRKATQGSVCDVHRDRALARDKARNAGRALDAIAPWSTDYGRWRKKIVERERAAKERERIAAKRAEKHAAAAKQAAA